MPKQFWLNGVQAAFIASLASVGMYVLVSLITPDPKLDTDKLFHRGPHASNPQPGKQGTDGQLNRSVPGWQRALGITEEFTLGDKLIFAAKYALIAFLFGSFVVLTVVNRVWGLMTDNQSWANWWLGMLVLHMLIGTAATIWFLVGGITGLKQLLKTLANAERDATDDGTVREHFGHPSEDSQAASEQQS